MKVHIHYDEAGHIVSVVAPNLDIPHVGVRTTGASSIAVVEDEDVKHPGHFAKIIEQYRVEPATRRLLRVVRK